ncbi:MAG TPA: hypothetical protein VFH03_07725 [Actinoplanes sp.]|nr:hypothetical protein [Actinoplanes sp.]
MSRRRALGLTAGATVALTAPAGCGLFDTEPEPLPEPDPLQPILDEALALATAFDRAAAAQPTLTARLLPLAEDHRAHAIELARVIGTAAASAAPSASAAPVAPTPAGLRAAEQAAARTATTAARTAPPERVGLLGSIAACRATHAEALRS